MHETWEYLVEATTVAISEIARACATHGEEGWELVSAVIVEEPPGNARTRLIFKRPKRR